MAKLHWTRRVRSIVSSVADVAGDWFFFDYVQNLSEDDFLSGDSDVWEFVVVATAAVSSVIGLISILTNAIGLQRCGGRSTFCGLVPSKLLHLMETILEDIPQVVVSTLIVRQLRGRPLSAQSVFNLTTSGINFFLDALDIFEPVPEEEPEQEANERMSYYNHGSSARARAY